MHKFILCLVYSPNTALKEEPVLWQTVLGTKLTSVDNHQNDSKDSITLLLSYKTQKSE